MSRFKLVISFCFFLACSPNKKIVLTMSEQQSRKWAGSSETAVLNQLGNYKTKNTQPVGYSLLFDYSVQNVSPLSKQVSNSQNLAVTHLDSKGNPVLVPKTNTATIAGLPNSRYAVNQQQKFMEFYFDSSRKVVYVYAEGYPDSIYYIKR